jgi:hypothetical protein
MVHRWPSWALKHGANPAWVEYKGDAGGQEWITESPIPRAKWLSVENCMTGFKVPI